MAGFLRVYNSASLRRPYMTNSIGSAVLFGAGDVLAQQGVESKGLKNHDIRRTARLAFYGGCIFAPLVTTWFRALNRVELRSKMLTTGARVALDQFVFTPVHLVVFFSGMSILEGQGTAEIKNRLTTFWQPTLFRNWGVFVPVQLANFAVVPPQLRLLVVNVVSLFYCYLSYANGQAAKHKDPPSLETTAEKLL